MKIMNSKWKSCLAATLLVLPGFSIAAPAERSDDIVSLSVYIDSMFSSESSNRRSPGRKAEDDSLRITYFHVDASKDILDRFLDLYAGYCNEIKGAIEFTIMRPPRSLKVLSCSREPNNKALFTVFVEGSPALWMVSDNKQCYSVLAAENKGLSSTDFAKTVLDLDAQLSQEGFYSPSRC